ncbi:MAG: sensor domain-containing diguanylate cyclase [Candidatus Izemoplasmatales bacterium]|nr:sensor domain-containing diguanylate cyclase [Candidatus Izemoplasmatales bacterium]
MDINYNKFSKDELIKEIEKLQAYNNELKESFKSQNANFLEEFRWAGNLGQWAWYYDKNVVLFNDRKTMNIGYDPKMVGEIGFEFFTNKLHPDDYSRVMNNMRKHLKGETQAYEVEYRIQHLDGHYLWYYDRGTVTKRDSEGKPLILQGVVFDITESKQVEEKLKYLSERDALTNIYNRRMLYEQINDCIMKKLKENKPFSLLMFDIDYFKAVNDNYGHLVGDQVLIELVDLVNKDKRAKDEVFRYGGEEFFMILPSTELQGAIVLAQRIHNAIQEKEMPKVGHITVSMGVVEYKEKETIDDVIKRVDDLMYLAKQEGRNLLRY